MDYRQTVRDEATKIGMDPNLAEAMMIQESAGNPNAVSPKGAQGLLQLMPATAKELGVDPADPLQNIQGGLRYAKAQIDKYGVPAGLAAYNAGPGRVSKTGDFTELPGETQDYVPKIMNRAAMIAETQGKAPALTAGPDLPTLLKGFEKAKAAGDAESTTEIGGLIAQKYGSALEKANAAGDTEAVTEISASLAQFQAPAAPPGAPGPEKAPVVAPAASPEAAEPPADFAKLGRTIYKAYKGSDFKGDDAKAAEFAKQFGSDFRWNSGSMAKTAATISGWSDEAKQAFLDLQRAYDAEPNFSGETLGRVAESVLTDPVTYLTMGAGKVIGKGAQAGTGKVVQAAVERQLGKQLAAKVASTAGKGAATGATMAAGQDSLTQTANIGAGGQDEYDASQTVKAAGLGGTLGAALGKVADKLTGSAAVRKLAQNAGSEEGAKVDAEIIQKLRDVSENPNFRGQPVRAEQLNTVAKGFITEADDAVRTVGAKEAAAQGSDAKTLRSALQNWKALTADEVDNLRGTPLGDSVADSVVKAQRTRSITAEQEAVGGIPKLVRSTLDVLPIPAPLRFAGRAVLGGGQSRKQTVADLLRPANLKAAQRISSDLGPSGAARSGDNLRALAQDALARQQAAAVAVVPRRRASTELEKIISKAQTQSDEGLSQARVFQQGLEEGVNEPVDLLRLAKKPPAPPSQIDQFIAGGMPETLHANAGPFQGLQAYVNAPAEDILNHLREIAGRSPAQAKVVEKALTPGTTMRRKEFYALQNQLQDKFGKKAPAPALAGSPAGPGALSSDVDAVGETIRSRPAYDNAAKVRQKVYSDAESSLSSSGLPEAAQAAAKKALHELKSGSPRNADAVLAKVQNHLASLPPEQQAGVEAALESALRFYRNQ